MNIYNICFMTRNRNGMNLSEPFVNLLILLAFYDALFLTTGIGLFGLPAVSNWYDNTIMREMLPKG